MLLEYVTGKLLDELYSRLQGLAGKENARLIVNKSELAAAIEHHLNMAKHWCSQVSFRDANKPRSLTEIYIDLQLYLTPISLQLVEEEKKRIKPVAEVVANLERNVVILGQPGAGKTTTLKRVCASLLLGDDFCDARFSMPVFLRLRDIRSNDEQPLIAELCNILGLRFAFLDSDLPDYRRSVRERFLLATLEELCPLLLLDGLDEIDLAMRELIGNDLGRLSLLLEKSAFIVSSRSAAFRMSLHDTDVFELRALSDDQVEVFCASFFGSQENAQTFIEKLKRSPYFDTRIRPLNLAHLCALFERLHDIPEKPKTLYRKLVGLLLEEWDEQKPLKRRSRYANFEVDRKRAFLSQLAFELVKLGHTTTFTRGDLQTVYLLELHESFGLEAREAMQVVTELETHTGLFLRTGHDQFEFAHKSLQEYLTAEYIVGLPEVPSDIKLLLKIPDELAICTAISSNADDYFASLMIKSLFSNDIVLPVERKDDRGVSGIFATHYYAQRTDPQLYFGRQARLDAELASRKSILIDLVSFWAPFFNRIELERVDFRSTPALGASCLYVYTRYSQFREDREIAGAIVEIVRFLSREPIKKALHRLLRYYQPITRARLHDVVLEKIGGADFSGPPILLCAPAIIT